MSVHDKTAANHARKYSLTVTRCSNGCMQVVEINRLTSDEVEAEEKFQQECWPGHALSFDVSTC